MFKFYLALYIAKLTEKLLKLLRRNASHFPGRVAITICPDFLGKIEKPKTVISVTGTNGKTTVVNLIIDSIEKNGTKVLSNRLGANVNAGVASALIKGTTLKNKTKYEIAVFEVDERSSPKVYPYIKPNYIVCTNLFRDSIMRNAHTEFIFNVINNAIPEESTLILNADDVISSQLGKENNKKVFFGIDKLDTDIKESSNLINDGICPKCHTKLEYNYLRYYHIGNFYCPNCDFKAETADYRISKVNKEENYIIVKHNEEDKKYKLFADTVFNMYNEITLITVLNELKFTEKQIQETISNIEIMQSRYQKENHNGVNIVCNMAKDLNAVACSIVFDNIRKNPGKKEVVLILDNYYDARTSSEMITWTYDADFEFLNNDEIQRIVATGKRCKDTKLRLLLAGIDRTKIADTVKEADAVNYLSLENGTTIYLLYGVDNVEIMNGLKKKIVEKLESEEVKTNA